MTTKLFTGDDSLDSRLADITASKPEALADPFTVWRELREEGPVYEQGADLFVSHYPAVKELFRDATRFSSRGWFEGSRAEAILSRLNDEQTAALHEVLSFEEHFMSRTDSEMHDRLRGIAHRAFTPRRIAKLEDAIRRFTAELLDSLPEDEPVDFIHNLAFRLPLLVIADMLGTPDEDIERIHEWTNRIAQNRGGDDPEALLPAQQALREFRAYVDDIIAGHRSAHSGGEDLVAALMDAEQGDRMTAEELTATFVLLLYAGHETTTNLLGNGLLELFRHPDQWQLLCEDPSRAANATEELLRFVSPVQWLPRVASEDCEFMGVEIKRGQTLIALLGAANRDPDVFEDPEEMQIMRPDAKRHLAFGFGPHFCLGNQLARVEGTVVFSSLARRFPELRRITAEEEIRWKGSWMFRGLRELQVELGPDHDRSGAAA